MGTGGVVFYEMRTRYSIFTSHSKFKINKVGIDPARIPDPSHECLSKIPAYIYFLHVDLFVSWRGTRHEKKKSTRRKFKRRKNQMRTKEKENPTLKEERKEKERKGIEEGEELQVAFLGDGLQGAPPRASRASRSQLELRPGSLHWKKLSLGLRKIIR